MLLSSIDFASDRERRALQMLVAEYAQEQLDASMENEIVRPRADVQPMKSDQRKVAAFDGSDNSTGAPYGLSAEWTAENDTSSDQTANVRSSSCTRGRCASTSRRVTSWWPMHPLSTRRSAMR